MNKYTGRRCFFYVRNRANLALIWVLVICVFLSCFALLVSSRLRPIISDYAAAMTKTIAAKTINLAIAEELSRGNDLYKDLITLEKDNDGGVKAIVTNTMGINILKVKVIEGVLLGLKSAETAQIRIPLGTMLNNDIFLGRGPAVLIKLVPVGAVNADFISEFKSCGVNQTLHRILLDIKVQMAVIVPGNTAYSEVSSTVTLSETVLLGEVPESYTYIDDTRGSIIEKINDYT